MRVLVLGINYAPERSGVAPFTTGLCEHLASQGHDVAVVTTFPYYPEWRVWDGYRGSFYRKDFANGVSVRRVWHFVPRRASRLAQRLVYDLSFMTTSFLAGLFTGKCNVIYCACPPLEVAFAAYLLARIRRVPYVIKLTDLASDAALATGILEEGWIVRLARALERFAYQNAESIICLCPGFVDKLTERGIPLGKFHLIPDWADTQEIGPSEQGHGFRSANGLSADQFLVLHTGNMGKKQDLMNVVRAAELSRDDLNLVWLLVGQGEERPVLENEVSRRNLTNVRLLPFQPRESLPQMYSAADVLLLNQRAKVEDAVIPSKLLTYMAAKRSVVAAVSEKSEAARQICRAKCGLVVPAENPEALVAAILKLRRDPALRRELGANGRTYAEKHFTKQKILQEYDQFFKRFTGQEKADVLASDKAVAAD
jgi:colanic acid biosynthesis glycosyl transferase WcaI